MANATRPTGPITAVTVGLAVVALAALVLTQVLGGTGSEPRATGSMLGEDTHVLDDAGADAPVLVEFLDFECEACAAVHPVIERVRERYDGRLTFAVRYFPLDGHRNAQGAARAVEAAARQGEIEQMSSMMFRTQAEWGEQDRDHAETFRGFAEEIGLDMERFDADVASGDVAERVEVDRRAGVAAGVSGTPSFFLDGERLEPQSLEELYTALDAAVGD